MVRYHMIGAFGFLSEYNLQNSVLRLKDIIDKTKDDGHVFVSINDTNNLYGAYKLFSQAKIKYIIGMKLSITHLGENTSLLAYAMDDTGYQNLVILSTMVQLSDQKRLTFEQVTSLQKGLYFISSGFESDIDMSILKGSLQEAKERMIHYHTHLDCFSVGLSIQNLNFELNVAPHLKGIANEENIKILPVNYMSYLKEDKYAYEAIIKISDDNLEKEVFDLSYKTPQELKLLYSEYKEVFDNLKEVLSLFTFKYQKYNYNLPSPVKVKDKKQVLYDLCLKGLREKLGKTNQITYKKYYDRLTYELNVIDEMGYNDYFLIVWDFVNYAKSKGILVGPGRGSAAGSLVSYALNITTVDPLKYGLLFERFLNKERRSMPDIDLDFPDDRRDEVIEYVKEKYGKDHVLSINTFSRFASKSAIRDICRIKGYTPHETNQIVSRLSSIQDNLDYRLKEVLELSMKLEGLPRQTGTHAAGIILAKEDLRYKIPLQTGSILYQSQFEHEDLEAMGLLKIDFLGIRNLNIINRVLELIEIHHQKIDIESIPLDDKKTYELLQSGDTEGIFQLESQGMRNVLRNLKPNSFNDIVALLALYRPGPMDNINTYIERRAGKKFTYEDPVLEPILKDTYGIIIYQEQIMMIAQSFAGYTLNEADMLRVGISKKDNTILEAGRETFIKRSIAMGHSSHQANVIYDYILKFADYGFNKSHSVAYSIVAYQMAYLKANYFDIFMSVLLSLSSSSEKDTSRYIRELRQRGFVVLKPDINRSTMNYEIVKEGILYPLTGIRGIGKVAGEKILSERLENGLFKDYEDFKNRVKGLIGDRVIESLIFSGALDIFNLNKQTLIDRMNQTIHDYGLVVSDIIFKESEEYPLDELIKKEREALGFNLIYNPLLKYESLMKQQNITPLSNLSSDNQNVKTLGMVIGIKEIKTRKGDVMAFIEVSDTMVSMDFTVFPEDYKKLRHLIKKGNSLIFNIQVNYYKGVSWILKGVEVINNS